MTLVRTPVAPWLRAAAVACAAAALPAAHAQFNISQVPAFLPTPLAPNVVLTLDDSGSMRSAFVPDDVCNGSSGNGIANSRRFKSSDFNPLYYNPRIRYEPAKTETGAYVPGAALNRFDAALLNGFDSTRGTLNLATSYQPTVAYNPASTSGPATAAACGSVAGSNHMYSDNPSPDFASGDARRGVAAYYYRYDPTATGCSPAANTNDACYVRVTVDATSGPAAVDINADGRVDTADRDERLNFANWYSFYRTRNLMTATATTLAFANMDATARVGWQALNNCDGFGTDCDGWDGVTFDSRLRVFAGAHRAAFFRWVSRLPSGGSTPLRRAASRAGEYFRTTFGVNSPWAESPYDGSASPNREFACRPNFHLLMTDGLWNEATGAFCSGATCGNTDGRSTTLTLPDGTVFGPSVAEAKLYRDGNSDSLADVVFHYWATDLRPTMDNKVLPYMVDRSGTAAERYWSPRNDPATWQHLTTFTVGLGLTDTLNVTSPVDIRWGGSTFAKPGFPNLAAPGTGNAPWPATASNATPGNVYDLWHAGINGRGAAFSAENPTQILVALQSSLNRVLSVQSSSASLAANSTRVSTGTRVFQARFNSGDWAGELNAFNINADGSVGTLAWSTAAGGVIPAPAARNIVTFGGFATPPAPRGVAFTESGLTSAGLWQDFPNGIAALPAAAVAGVAQAVVADDYLQYVRGDQSKEQSAVGGLYRTRTSILGDIVNSSPAYVGAANFGYAVLPEGRAAATSYQAFYNSQASRTPMVYVGSNGGMLHGFDAGTGAERFAFVPQALLSSLPKLSDPNYAHRYFVDGSPLVQDAFLGGSWRTVLVGTAGAGAKTIFALDVTDPSSLGTGSVLWELNSATAFRSGVDSADPDYANDLGFIVGQGIPIKLNSGDWAVIFGNGLNSVRNRAVLYVVRLSDGALIRKFDTAVGTASLPNGLGTPALRDSNGDLVADIVYAPDMRGNVWKFDLSSANPASWSIAYGAAAGFPNGQPLFQARNASGQEQPIETSLELATAPTGLGGVIVVFGTGRLLMVGDNVDTRQQSYYGIWDNGSPVPGTNRSALVQQTITEANGVRQVSTHPVALSAAVRGWYMDLPSPLERVIGPAFINEERILFTTVVPSTDPCDFGGTSWLMQVNAQSGARLSRPGFDTNRDGIVNGLDDITVSGVAPGIGLIRSASVLRSSNNATDTAIFNGSAVSGNAGGPNGDGQPSGGGGGPGGGLPGGPDTEKVAGSLNGGRNSWRQER